MEMRLIIDADTCVGYGECVAQDAEAVELDGSGCARPLTAALAAARAERICAACPVGAITLQPAA
ncbi:MAG TPA: ferredoxin [Gaiellales bacterium]|jgi:ferredoxin